jgi:hypothetical protein
MFIVKFIEDVKPGTNFVPEGASLHVKVSFKESPEAGVLSLTVGLTQSNRHKALVTFNFKGLVDVLKSTLDMLPVELTSFVTQKLTLTMVFGATQIGTTEAFELWFNTPKFPA